MRLVFSTIPLLLCLAISNGAFAQDTIVRTHLGKVERMPDIVYAWDTAKIGRHFALKGYYKTVDGKDIGFDHPDQPTFVCLGFYGCHPCEHELPLFVRLSAEHPELNFVYITFNNEQVRLREWNEVGLKDVRPGRNYYVIHMSGDDILKNNLAPGYPTHYFINKEGIVKRMFHGGGPYELEPDFKERMMKIAKAGS